MNWFLVFVGGIFGPQYIGPLPQQRCEMAAAVLYNEGVACRQSYMTMSCDVPNRPGAYMACPVFDYTPSTGVVK